MTEFSKNGFIEKAALKASISSRTASRLVKKLKHAEEEGTNCLRPHASKPRTHKTRQDPFAKHWKDIESRLTEHPTLEAKTLLALLIEENPDLYRASHLRTLQRRIARFQLEHGADKAVIFRQTLYPARQSQSDWTHMKSLGITIKGEPFDHLLFHFMLPYSRWEMVMIQESESFDNLVRGYERAVMMMGGVAHEHRTDNLSAATQKEGCSRRFTNRWQQVMNHYDVTPSRNNPGVSNENGSVEKSHDLFKKAVNQALMLRRNRDFGDQSDYNFFLQNIAIKRNLLRLAKFQEEQALFKPLPETTFNEVTLLKCHVSPCSTVQILSVTYSVPSRLINTWLTAYVYRDYIELKSGGVIVETVPRVEAGAVINYRHIIDSLCKKPGAFEHYQFKQYLFPSVIFRKTYDVLKDTSSKSTKVYVDILQLAKREGEANVSAALELLLHEKKIPNRLNVLALVQKHRELILPEGRVDDVNLNDYDVLTDFAFIQTMSEEAA